MASEKLRLCVWLVFVAHIMLLLDSPGLDFSQCLISVSLICPANLTSFCFMSTSLSTRVLTVLPWAQTNTAQPLLYGKALANCYDPQWKFQTELTLSRLFIPSLSNLVLWLSASHFMF